MRSRRLLESIQADLRELRKELAVGGDAKGDKHAETARTRASYQAELTDLASRLEAIEESESYRLGHAIVRMVRSPVASLRGLGSRRRARLRRGTAGGRARAVGVSARPGVGEGFSIPAGDRTVGPLNDHPSTTMFLLWGLADDAVQSLVDDVARLQVMLRDFKPLFVTDSDSWAAFQEHGYWFEYIPPAEEWGRHRDPGEWPDYVAERIDSIVATYAPDRVIVYESGPGNEALRGGLLNSIVGGSSAALERTTLPR
jgi:hypothetical protein